MAGLVIWHVLTKVEGRHVWHLQELRLRVAGVLLSERLKGVGLFGAAHLFIACASRGVLNHSDDLLVFVIQGFQHFATGFGWPLSSFSKNLRVALHHAFLLRVGHAFFS